MENVDIENNTPCSPKAPESVKKNRVDRPVSAGILFALCAIFFAYGLVFVYFPNRKFMNRENSECIIREAKLACWRRKLFSSSAIEEGRFICWQFVVRHSENNVTTRVQYMKVRHFPLELDGCKSEEECGMEDWPCRVSDNPDIVSLRWSYPVRKMLYAVVGVLITLFFGISALLQHHRQKDDAEQCETGNGTNFIPFFRPTQ